MLPAWSGGCSIRGQWPAGIPLDHGQGQAKREGATLEPRSQLEMPPLTLPSLTLQDEGAYICQITTSLFRAQQVIQLDIQQVRPGPVTLQRGKEYAYESVFRNGIKHKSTLPRGGLRVPQPECLYPRSMDGIILSFLIRLSENSIQFPIRPQDNSTEKCPRPRPCCPAPAGYLPSPQSF